MMKLFRFFSLLISLLLLASLLLVSCGNTVTTSGSPAGTGSSPSGSDNDDPQNGGDVWIKCFKAGRAGAVLVRTATATVLINTGDEKDEETRGGAATPNGMTDDAEKILEYLGEKGITKIDCLIITEFNKNYIGGVPTILDNVSVARVIEPDYTRAVKDTYQTYKDALAAKGLTAERIGEKKTETIGGAAFGFYPTAISTTVSALDEFNSLVVSVSSNDFSALFTSDIFGARTNEVVADLSGKTFDVLQIPNHGSFDSSVESLIDAVKPSYAVIFTSTNNPADVRTTNLLSSKEITTYLSKEGSVEIKYKDGVLTVKQ